MFYYRIVTTGEALGAAHSVAQDQEWIARYKAALGITDEVEAFESDSDPRKVDARKEPAPPPASQSALAKALDALSKDAALAPATKTALTDALKG